MTDAEYEYMAEVISARLIGAIITESISTPDGDAFGFKVNTPDGELLVWVDCDPEGNGPGWLAIEAPQ